MSNTRNKNQICIYIYWFVNHKAHSYMLYFLLQRDVMKAKNRNVYYSMLIDKTFLSIEDVEFQHNANNVLCFVDNNLDKMLKCY